MIGTFQDTYPWQILGKTPMAPSSSLQQLKPAGNFKSLELLILCMLLKVVEFWYISFLWKPYSDSYKYEFFLMILFSWNKIWF